MSTHPSIATSWPPSRHPNSHGNHSTAETEHVRSIAKVQSLGHLRARLRYGIRNRGLPNMTPEMCLARLVEMDA